MATNIQTLKGFRDFLPSEARKRQFVINTLKKVFESYGFEPLETPALEYEDILLGKYGDEGDKLMYRFTDNGDRRVALRYDQTVPLARVAAQYANTLPLPFKRYQIQPVWRAENTQKGRFREFLQCDADIVGSSSWLADAEILTVATESLKKLGFKGINVTINHRKVFDNLPKEVITIIDKIKKIGEDGVYNELINKGIVTSKNEAKNLLDKLRNTAADIANNEFSYISSHFPVSDEVLFITGNNAASLARGLDYYTGLIFEIEIDGYSAGSVCGGGRYDKLIGMFTGKDIPAVGFAFGFDRVMEAMESLDLFPKDLTTTKALVTIFSTQLAEESIKTATLLRNKGINIEVWLDPDSKLEKQLKYADQKNIPYTIIIGEEEVNTGKVVLKDLKNRTQQSLTLDEVVQKLTQ